MTNGSGRGVLSGEHHIDSGRVGPGSLRVNPGWAGPIAMMQIAGHAWNGARSLRQPDSETMGVGWPLKTANLSHRVPPGWPGAVLVPFFGLVDVILTMNHHRSNTATATKGDIQFASDQ